MIIDIHTHTFPEKIAAKAIGKLSLAAHCKTHTDASIPGLIRSMERSGVDRSVLAPVATSPQQVEKINDAAAANCEAFENQGILSFGCIHPEYENYRDELARIQALGLKGIKIHPVYQGMDIDDVRFLRILDRAAELGLVVLTHGGQDIGFPGVVHVSPAMCRHVMDQIGAVPQENDVAFYGFLIDHYCDTMLRNGEMDATVVQDERFAIPKVIHYCWFGRGRIPVHYRAWMESWKKFCPDYEIVEWC